MTTSAAIRREHTLAQLRHLTRLAGPRRPRAHAIPRGSAPTGVALAYLQDLLRMLNRARELLDQALQPRFEALLAKAHRHDAAGLEDDDFADEVDRLVSDVFHTVKAEFGKERAKATAAKAARAASDASKRQTTAQLHAALGVDPLFAEPWMESKVSTFVAENVALITRVREEYRGRIAADLIRSIRTGARHEELAAVLEDDFGWAKNKAALVARDQTLSFFADLNKARQTDLGIKRFIWRTSGDDRVRDQHAERDGEVYTWEDGTGEKGDAFPGEAINCRCTAEPVVDDLLTALQETEP